MSANKVRPIALLTLIALTGCGTIGQASGRSGTHHRTKVSGSRSKTTKKAATTTRGGKMMVLGFWAHHKSLPATSLASEKHSLTAISPLWYGLTASGGVKTKVDTSLLSETKKLHIPITPIVNDVTGTQAFLTSKATRTTAVQTIDHIVASMHYRGVNIDFEPPHTHLRSELTAFMVQLRDTLPKTDTITMDVVPHSGGAYDYTKLAPEVNQFVLMSYDEHSDGTPAGPVAAMNWVKSITARMTSKVPPSKVMLGVALYGYSWPSGSTHATTIPYYAITAADKSHATWNTRYQEMTATVGPDVLWWENRKSMAEKIAFAKSSHLAGIALWQVGYANPAVYSLLAKDAG